MGLIKLSDASRFLAQSQSRVGFGPQEESPRRNPLQRARRQDEASSRLHSTRSYAQRPTLGNPYQAGSSFSQFPFAPRAAPYAPLFYSAHDRFREDDEEEEHEREVADFYALQRSRRQFGGSRLEESSEAEDDGSRGSGLEGSADGRDTDERGFSRGGGIKSSWRGEKPIKKGKGTPTGETNGDNATRLKRLDGEASSNNGGNMEDVGLESVARSSTDGMDRDGPPDDLAVEISPDDDPPSAQHFRTSPKMKFAERSVFFPHDTAPDDAYRSPYPPGSDASSAPPTVSYPSEIPPRHDAFWGTLYLISLAALFASFFLIYLHTSAPSLPLGDTIYTTLHGSYYLLAVDTLVAVIVSILWLAVLRSYLRPLMYTILVAVPIILFAFFLYPLIWSYRGTYHGDSIQDKAMRWFSFVPGILALVWAVALYKGRHSLGKAISILEFSCRILAANPGLLVVGFATLAGVIIWTWLWMAMFTRVFLGGHLSAGAKLYIIDASTWWLGIFFVLVYLWTLGVMSGIQRTTTAATVSQWYFHRLTVPSPTSSEVINAAFVHATSTLFGTICLSTLLALAIRLPYLIMPRRFLALAGLCTYTVLPSAIATLTNPLTLTYSAIHSQALTTSSRALARLSFLAPSDKHPHSAQFNARNTPSQTPLHSYTLSLLLLRATRFITSLALGFGGWVSTARSLTLSSATGESTIKGSLYAYVVGLIAGAIGWGVLGAMDGVVAGVVDAVVICWGSEVGRGGGVRYCREAEHLFSEDQTGDEENQRFLRQAG
ncbi:MAG: hypothetical protein Q9163_001323 [Psora crenata]